MTEEPNTAHPRMTAQPYPLWCAAVAEDDTQVEVGLIVGWLPPWSENDSSSRDQYPVVAAIDGYGRTQRIGLPLDDDELFIADSRYLAEQHALKWVNRRRNFAFRSTEAAWAGDQLATLAKAHAEAKRKYLRPVGEPAVKRYQDQGEVMVTLTWKNVEPLHQVRLGEDGELVAVDLEGNDLTAAEAGKHNFTAEDVRNVWPDMVNAVSRTNKRVATLARDAVVKQVDRTTVVLTVKSPVLAQMLAEHSKVLVEVLHEKLGVTWEIRCVVAGDPPSKR